MIDVVDTDDDPLVYRWEIMKESNTAATGGDAEEVPEVIQGLIKSDPSANVTFNAPKDKGAYRLFIYVDDNHEHTAHANIPFYVN